MLSAVVITKDEEKNIGRCLASLSRVDEVIVVDAGSKDNTVAIARQQGATVYQNKWRGYGPQKNFGLARAKGDWVLFIDADEEITADLAHEITHYTQATVQADIYWLKIITVFLGKPLRHLYGHNPRLFRKGAAKWTDSFVHEQVVTKDGQIIKLDASKSAISKGLLWHYSHQTVASYLQKMRRYTTLDARQMYKSGRHRSGKTIKPGIFLPLRLSSKQLLKLLFYRQGIRDGWQGMLWCILSAYYEFEMARKYGQLVKNRP